MREQSKVTIAKDILLIFLIVSFLPAFRSGLRDRLNFWQWVYEHTIWGHPILYVPEEKYEVLAGQAHFLSTVSREEVTTS